MQTSTGVLGGLLVPTPGRSETAPEVRVCPKSTPPARRLLAFRMGELTSFAWDVRLTLTCLQAIVNRSQPLCVLKIRLLSKSATRRNPTSGRLSHVNWAHDPAPPGFSFLVGCLLPLAA
jgi:hypothetical protein